jgi:glycogen operon protein
VADIAWFRPDGQQMADEDWHRSHTNSFAVFLNGDALRELDDDGRPVRDDSFLLLFNAHHEPLTFTLPAASFGRRWDVILDTSAGLRLTPRILNAGENHTVADRTMLVLSRASSA